MIKKIEKNLHKRTENRYRWTNESKEECKRTRAKKVFPASILAFLTATLATITALVSNLCIVWESVPTRSTTFFFWENSISNLGRRNDFRKLYTCLAAYLISLWAFSVSVHVTSWLTESSIVQEAAITNRKQPQERSKHFSHKSQYHHHQPKREHQRPIYHTQYSAAVRANLLVPPCFLTPYYFFQNSKKVCLFAKSLRSETESSDLHLVDSK